MKKKIWVLFIIFITILLNFGIENIVFAEPVYFKGEGYVEPSPSSLVPFNPELLNKINRDQSPANYAVTVANYTVTVNPLATNFPNIILYVSVLDSSNKLVSGLTKNDFTVTEKSSSEATPTTETITTFSESTTASGMSIALVFDVSGSMSGTPLANAKTAAINFINNCTAIDRVSLVKFETTASVVKTSDFVNVDADHNGTWDIIESINSLSTLNNTALYDGTGLGIDTLSQEPSPKAVIVFTDGATNSDSAGHTINWLIQKAQNTTTPIYTIGLGIDPQNLKDMAAGTGGQYKYAPGAADMQAIYNAIAQGLKSQYIIGYTTHNPNYNGETRTATATYSGVSGQGVYVVNYKPTIALDSATIQLSSQSQNPNTSLAIKGYVTDLDAAARSQQVSAKLFYKTVGSTSFTSVNLTLTAAANGIFNFTGTIPANTVVEPGVLYYLYATDTIQETYLPFNYNVNAFSIPVLQNHAPVITHTPVTSTSKNRAITITAGITDPDAGDTISQAILYYRINDPNQKTPYSSVIMSSTNGTTYTGVIPADKVVKPGVDYFISAWDNHQVKTDNGYADNPYLIKIAGANIQINMNDPSNCIPILTFSATMSIQ